MSLASSKPITQVAFLGKKSSLNCFAHSLLALNCNYKLRDWCVAGLEKSQPSAWGLSFPGFSARQMVVFTALLAPLASCCTNWRGGKAISQGLLLPVRALLTSVISGSSVQVGWKLFPFPSMNFDEVLPERQMTMSFFGRMGGNPWGSWMSLVPERHSHSDDRNKLGLQKEMCTVCAWVMIRWELLLVLR